MGLSHPNQLAQPLNGRLMEARHEDAVLFVDSAFPPVSSSLGPGLPEASCWLRCAELWPRAALPPSPGDIVVEQGQVGDCWLLAPLSGHELSTAQCFPAFPARGDVAEILSMVKLQMVVVVLYSSLKV